jgi:chitin synthase
MDDFSWGNTRIVVGEGKSKKVLATDDDTFDDSMIPMRKFSGASTHTSHLTRSRSMGG